MNPGERTKASQLRKRVREGLPISPEQIAWLHDYDARQRDELPPGTNGELPAGTAGVRAALGASQASRVVHVEEHAASFGTGSAAEVAAAAAFSREEGRRIDYLARTGIDALVKACELHRAMAETLLARTNAIEEVHISMLEAVRTQYLARTQAEIDTMQAQAQAGDDGSVENQLGALLAQKLLTPEKPGKPPKK